MAKQTVRFFFEDLASAAEGLVAVLEHARKTKGVSYRFGPMEAHAVLRNGLWIEGTLGDLPAILEQVSGATREDE